MGGKKDGRINYRNSFIFNLHCNFLSTARFILMCRPLDFNQPKSFIQLGMNVVLPVETLIFTNFSFLHQCYKQGHLVKSGCEKVMDIFNLNPHGCMWNWIFYSKSIKNYIKAIFI